MSVDEIKRYNKRPRTDKQAKAWVLRCLNELYMASTPSITFKELEKLYGNTNEQFWEKHVIPKYLSKQIIEKYEKLLPIRYHGLLCMSLLDYSPKEV